MDSTNSKIDTPVTRGRSGFDPDAARDLYRKIPTMPKAARRFAYNLIEMIEGNVMAKRPAGNHWLQQPAVLIERQIARLERALKQATAA